MTGRRVASIAFPATLILKGGLLGGFHHHFSTAEERAPMSKFALQADSETPIVPGVFLNTPSKNKDIPFIKRWKDATFFSKRTLFLSGWTLLVEGPVCPECLASNRHLD